MEIKLKAIWLANFKGIKSISLNFTENDHLHLLGANATGKTTIYDAFLWLLFGKDSSGRSDFEIKTLDKNGETKKDLEHSVEAILSVDGVDIKLKKVYKEKWSRKRGTKVDEFIGNETIFYWNEVPVKKDEYTSKVSGILDESRFRLLSDTKYFNSLDWKVRRKLLFDVVSTDPSNDAGIMSSELREALKGKTRDELTKQLAATRKKLLNDIDQFPTRIDEVTRSIEEIHDISGYEDVVNDITSIDAKLSGAKSMSAANERKVKELMQEKGKLVEKIESIKYDITFSKKNVIRILAEEIEVKTDAIKNLRTKLTGIEYNGKEAKNRIEKFEKIIQQLREDYNSENEREFAYEDKCPTCGSPVKEDRIEELRGNYNKNKSKKLEEIIQEATEKKKDLALFTEAYSTAINEYNNVKSKIEILETEIAETNNKIKEQQDDVDRVTQIEIEGSILIKDLQKQMEIINAKVEKIDTPATNNSMLVEQRKKLLERKNELDRLKHENEVTEKNILRIDALEQERLTALELLSKTEALQFELSEYQRLLIEMIEGRLKDMFHGVGFKMFDVQINGGIDETCVVTRDGVPYSDLNTASKMWVSLNIIDTFSDHYHLRTPIFIDNRESVTDIPQMNQQTISLIVSPNHKKITLCPAKNKQS